jgi:hypothetical protein
MRKPKFQVLDTMDGSELRYLLSLERLGLLDGPQKDRLGLLLMNVARTAVAQMIADGAFTDLAAFRAALPESFTITEYLPKA